MSDREKVIKGLQIERECVSRDCDRDCGNCDLVQDRDWLLSVYDGALALLKEQEPRVLTLDEADAAEVVWFEARNHIFIEPMLTRGQRLADEAEDWFQYGRDWRCWSARPSDKQREEAPWDEITG
jgi:hypothetical protein